ncbi:MAG TPA: hypothetical protein ENL06_00655 [Candidatus Portnoybacteria bacterium]|nr:hypothetical protein [Candidatus Portnoybacteria bacterium]
MYKINKQKCSGCQVCLQNCPDAIKIGADGKAEIVDQEKIEQCGGASVCPFGAIEKTDGNSNNSNKENDSSDKSEPSQSNDRGIGRGLGRGMGRGLGMGKGRGLGLGPRDGRGMGMGRGRR